MHKLSTLGLATALLAISFTASAQLAYTTRSINVRAGPDTSYPPVAVLPPGASVQVMGCLDDWSWCDVVFGDNRGWSYAPYLNYDYQGARVPFYAYAPAFGIPIVTFALGSYWDRYYRGRDFYGRRDYWGGRTFTHVTPSGPAPRAAIPSSLRGHNEVQGSANRAGGKTVINNRVDVHNSREVNVTKGQRNTQVVAGGKPAPTVGRTQDMRKGAPAGPASHGAPQGKAPQGHAPQGNAAHNNEHAGGKDEKH
jgi:uncharacterized protein YraI